MCSVCASVLTHALVQLFQFLQLHDQNWQAQVKLDPKTCTEASKVTIATLP